MAQPALRTHIRQPLYKLDSGNGAVSHGMVKGALPKVVKVCRLAPPQCAATAATEALRATNAAPSRSSDAGALLAPRTWLTPAAQEIRVHRRLGLPCTRGHDEGRRHLGSRGRRAPPCRRRGAVHLRPPSRGQGT